MLIWKYFCLQPVKGSFILLCQIKIYLFSFPLCPFLGICLSYSLSKGLSLGKLFLTCLIPLNCVNKNCFQKEVWYLLISLYVSFCGQRTFPAIEKVVGFFESTRVNYNHFQKKYCLFDSNWITCSKVHLKKNPIHLPPFLSSETMSKFSGEQISWFHYNCQKNIRQFKLKTLFGTIFWIADM